MTRSIFGWSLPPGVTTLPGDEPEPPLPGDPNWPRCACGALLRMEPDVIEGAPTHPPCPRHGMEYARCEAAERKTYEVDPDSLSAEDWEETRGCIGMWLPTYFYRRCRRCQAITRYEVM